MGDLDEIDVEELDLSDLKALYRELLHGVQSGIRMRMNDPNYDGANPKHLRVGINSAMISHAALAQVLLDKDIMTEEEYFGALVDSAIDEVQMLEEEVSDSMGGGIDISFR